MSTATTIRGARPVARIGDLDLLEVAAILYLRLWCDTEAAQRQVRRDFVGTLGPASGPEAVAALDDLCNLCMQHGRRPLTLHLTTCTCVGADEACLANLTALAAAGEREDALLISTLLVRAEHAPQVATIARIFGLALVHMVRKADQAVASLAQRHLH